MTETAYLSLLGDRVRAWRSEQGMTRKSLAAASGVSERYLAQLEAGEGNISVLLLRKVARAMGVPVETLVREEAPREKPVALLGLRGAGKSTLGTRLAEALGVPEGTVRSRLHHAMRGLRAALDADARPARREGSQ